MLYGPRVWLTPDCTPAPRCAPMSKMLMDSHATMVPSRMSIGKTKLLFTPSHPPASGHPLPSCARWCPRLGSARTPPAARLAQALPGRAGGAPRPRRASPVGRRQATGPRRRARPGRGPGVAALWLCRHNAAPQSMGRCATQNMRHGHPGVDNERLRGPYTRRVCPCQYGSRSSRFRILP